MKKLQHLLGSLLGVALIAAVIALTISAAPVLSQSNSTGITVWQANQNFINTLIANVIASIQWGGDVTGVAVGNKINLTVVSTHLAAPLPISQGGTGNTNGTATGISTPINIQGSNTASAPADVMRFVSVGNVINATAAPYGAKADRREGGDGVTNTTKTFTSVTGNFTSQDLGKSLVVAGATGFVNGTIVTAVNSGTSITVNNTALGSAGSHKWYLGTNDQVAFQAAYDANCTASSSDYTGVLYIPAGNYLIDSTTTGSVLQFNTVGCGGNTFITSSRVTGDSGRGSSFNSGTYAATNIILAADSAKLGVDQFGNGYDEWSNIDLEEPVNAAGPVALAGWGKTTTSDADIHAVHDSNFVTRTTSSSTYVWMLYGAENFNVVNTEIDPIAGGDGIDWSGLNTIGITSAGQTLHSTPVSATIFNMRDGNSTIDTNGGATTPATGFLIDDGTSNTIASIHLGDYFKMTGKEDIGIGDVGASSSETYQDLTVVGRFELQFAGSNTAQAIALAGNITGSTLKPNLSENTTSSSPIIAVANAYMSTILATPPNAGTCISLASAAGSHLTADAGCSITNTSLDALEISSNGVNKSLLRANQFAGSPSVSISGGGSLATGSTSFFGVVTAAAATGNVITPGFTCPNAVVLLLTDNTTLGGAAQTASSATTGTFSATASDSVNYLAGCR